LSCSGAKHDPTKAKQDKKNKHKVVTLNMSSTPLNNAKAVQEGYETTVSLGKEESAEFAKYGLSPLQRTFTESVRRIQKEFKETRESGTYDQKKILPFLYSRGLHRHSKKLMRVGHAEEMLRAGKVRERMLQIINADGDIDISSIDKWQLHYIRTCLTLHRYFRQTGAKGFVTDMSSLVYYLREQMHGTCFLQAACVTMCYMLQSHGVVVPPVEMVRD
jgi:hypothetical protein